MTITSINPTGGYSFMGAYREMCKELLEAPIVDTGEWQAMDTRGSKAHATRELEDVTVKYPIPRLANDLISEVQPDVAWAEEHFGERISGKPLNPAPSHVRWPYTVRGNADHITDQAFDHTYPERFWPKEANGAGTPPFGRQMHGIRFQYGDLSDVVKLLARRPLTRQAYLPVWFPEDTGAVQGQRVPCTLGYHFMVRGGDYEQPDRLSCRYFIRSCDIYRHFRNDVYLACRLTQWLADRINGIWSDESDHIRRSARIIKPARLTMFISSLHAFVGDTGKIKEIING